MTIERVLAVCRSNWEYRGIDDTSVREMLDELTAHLEDAAAAGRSPKDVVGEDVTAFAASWARARMPLHRRVLRMTAMVSFMAGVLLLFSHLTRWTTGVEVTPGRLAFWLGIAVATVVLELRRGSLGLGKGWLVALVVGLPVALLTETLLGDEPLFRVPLWATVLLTLPGLAYAVAERRGVAADLRGGAASDDAPHLR
ncbi:hypothetical protein J7E93_18185 [Streptomyces sp. ISL-36]|uniref:DUF1048 domain-containing protein n=1 Tax=Streptomyces sp. ISL-36 TaxID=2819182 RepID=UPI001BEA5239|nr:DUF1048 domain-containing protein [Streptomyces sp. ISL-36]MBT2441999.1 hypothetical protein [Streptomyces sp. ISL-36]